MKAVILAGGFGSRLSEETALRPKPMVEIGGRPILWHIMKTFAAAGVQDFVVCCGYKGYLIKEYFANYALHQSDVTIDLALNSIAVHSCKAEPWKVTLVDTGEATMTGGRLLRVAAHVGASPFFFTYGDGVSDVDLLALLSHHRRCGMRATVTAVRAPARFGALVVQGNRIVGFQEKPMGESWINGGYFVLDPSVFEYIAGDDTVWEREPMERLTAESQLSAYFHTGFFQPMDTLRDKAVLEELCRAGQAPWMRRWSAPASPSPAANDASPL